VKMPWDNKTGLVKATAVLVTTLGVSTGLCGLNLIASRSMRLVEAASTTLLVTAFAESAVMVASAIGLLIVLFLAIIAWLRKRFSKPAEEETL
jgi:hypothetical protein